MDKLVIDIETKNMFADVGGERNLPLLDMSVVGVYSYSKNEYLCFDEYQLDALGVLLKRTGLLIGFSLNRFDVPVLAKYFSFNLKAIPTLDILEEVELALGHRISLDALAKTNLHGDGKTGHGTDAAKLYREGKIEELKKYCLNDVRLTKELYDLAMKQKHLLVPNRYSTVCDKAEFDWAEQVLPATLF